MVRLTPVSRRELISRLRRLGLEGPYAGGSHQFISEPEQYEEVRPGRVVVQSRILMEKPAKSYLVRVFVDLEPHVAEVVTAYRISKIAKYWKGNYEG